MRNKGVVIILTIVITLLCTYYQSFTLVSYQINQQATEYATDKNKTVSLSRRQHYLDSLWNIPVYSLFGKEYTYHEVKENELSLGLDLQGGMHVILEVSPVDIVAGLSTEKDDPKFIGTLKYARDSQLRTGDDFFAAFYNRFHEEFPGTRLATFFVSKSTGRQVSQSTSDDDVLRFLRAETENAIERSFTILKTRIDQFGTSQPNIQRLQGSGRIQIEVPGADNPQRVRKLLQGVAQLQFYDVIEYGDPRITAMMSSVNRVMLNEHVRVEKDTTTTTSRDLESLLQASNDSISVDYVSPLLKFSSVETPFYYNLKDTAAVNRVLNRPDIQDMIPRNIGYFWHVKPDQRVTPGIEDIQLTFVNLGRNNQPLLNGDMISDARLDYDNFARPAVTMTMKSAGAITWAKVTAAAANRTPQGRIAIVLDKYVYTAPTVQGEIPNGNSQISGDFTTEEAKDLANVLKAGSLPAPARIVEEAIIGPSLGKTAQDQGFASMACGLSIVVVFMIAYYSKGGAISDVALLFNIFFILGILAQLNAALTLPGIAGIVLTMGMAVDANVLIFERIREELRLGRNLREAVKRGYERAFATIFDSNVTTFLTAMFLFVLGQGPLKGFAITLMIGIMTSFFSAVYISRVIIEWMLRKGNTNLSFATGFSMWFSRKRDFDFMRIRKVTYMISCVVLFIGFVLLAIQGLNLGVDFKGGRSYTVTFNKPVVATELRVALAKSFENQGTEVKNYGSNNVMKVTTSYRVDDDSEETDHAVKDALINGIQTYTHLQYADHESGVDDGHFAISSSTKVGATVADDIKSSAFRASLFSMLGIFFYILIRFRKWQYSVGAIMATIHDGLFVFAAFAIARALGYSFEIDQVFVAAFLTVIGYSINDTVIIYDRIREQTANNFKDLKLQVFNDALNLTLSRTLITSGTTLFVVTVLLFFGGEVLRGFSFALFIGIVVGTYSSIFIAAPMVADLDRVGKAEPVLKEA